MNHSGIIIVCHSCGARLKAGKGLIGKSVSCPKCQSKIKVSENLTKEITHPNDSLLEKTTVAGSNFEDIDSLLQSQKNTDSSITAPLAGKPQTPITDPNSLPVDPRSVPQKKKSPKKLFAQLHSTADQTDAKEDSRSNRRFRGSVPKNKMSKETISGGTVSIDPRNLPTSIDGAPLLPDDKWNNPAAIRRSRWTKGGAIAIAALLLISIGTALWMQPQTGNVALTDSNATEPGESETHQTDQPNPKDELEAENAPVLGQPNATPELPPEQPNPADDVNPIDPNSVKNDQGSANLLARSLDPDRDSDDTENRIDLTTSIENLPPLKTTDPIDLTENTADQPPPELPAFPGGDRDKTNDSESHSAGQSMADAIEKERLAKLAELLDEGQLATSRFHYLIPERREERLIGPPNFIVQRSEISNPDPQRQFDAICPKLTYHETPLSVIIDDLMAITGIPMTVDLGAVEAMTGVTNPLLSVNLSGPTLGEAIDSMLEKLKLAKVIADSQGVIITALQADQLSLFKTALPKFPFRDQAEIDLVRQELINGIQTMFSPQSWQTGGNLGRIWIEQEELLINNTPLVHHQIQDLIDRIDAALILLETPDDPQAMQILQTRLSRLQPRLTAVTGMQHTVARPLVQYLRQIQQNANVTVLADWESLAGAGWHAQTSIPGKLYGKNLADALLSLTQTLDITYIAVGDNTIWLTTYASAESLNYLEFYPLGKLTREKLSQQQVLEIFNEVLGADFRQPDVQVIFEPKYGSLILIAPQYIHRRVESLLQGLEEL